ncbi:MAG: hypothetical protein HQ592_18280 [Planctomycetes bacterium]|nr:hypothetical protein [Planctomycetota bacterium]
MARKKDLNSLVTALLEHAGEGAVSADQLWAAVRNAVDPLGLINNLSEAMRVSAGETEALLEQNDFGDLVMQAKMAAGAPGAAAGAAGAAVVEEAPSPFPQLFSVEARSPTPIAGELQETVDKLVGSILPTVEGDSFAEAYRGHVQKFFDGFMKTDALRIRDYVADAFGDDGPTYLVNSGIGANEQSNHFIAHLYNRSPGKKCRWLVVNSPRRLAELPADATVDNTLFMEFSRSGKTEETVKIHEYTPREAKRIVFANAGPLRELGERDGNLVLGLPDNISGRFGRDKTPILLAPMLAAGMEVLDFWQDIGKAIEAFDLAGADGLPLRIGRFIYAHQKARGTNHVYLACNDDALIMLGDEFTQFWNEGVTKDDNDVTMSRYLGLPRDSHMNLEGILANHKTKMAVCLFTDTPVEGELHPLVREEIDPINPDHAGLRFGDEEIILAEANYVRLSELMPCVRITLHGRPSLEHAAVIGQLWADITFWYSRLMNIDPGSNPEVKVVRERAATLLARGIAHSAAPPA